MWGGDRGEEWEEKVGEEVIAILNREGDIIVIDFI